MKDKNWHIKSNNLDKNKFFNTLQFLLRAFFYNNYDIFICKAPSGANILLKLLKYFIISPKRIHVYIYGYGINVAAYSYLKPSDFSRLHTLIVESNSVKKQFMELSTKINLLVLPSVKRVYDIPIRPFEKKETLSILFFSRIVKEKGVFDAINSVIKINEANNRVLYKLDIAGSESSFEEIEQIKKICERHSYINLLGESFTIQNQNSYIRFSVYDLHVFLSTFFHECVPGSIIDSFISCVPTISTKYNSYETLINDNIAYILDDLNPDTITSKLLYIYQHQDDLYGRKMKCKLEAAKYSSEYFINFMEEKVLKNDKGEGLHNINSGLLQVHGCS
ncbi:MAG: glycosyltransferase [Candidatus Absconditabacteria bacterium]